MKILFTFAALMMAAIGAYAQTQVAALPKTAPDPAAVRMQAFDKVWSTVNENHYDPTFGGVDWSKVRRDYLPQAEAARTDDELHNVLRRMLGELKLSHFGIAPKPPEIRSARGLIGVELKMLDGRPTVSRVDADSPAFAAGVRPGFIISKIGGKNASEILKPLENSFAARSLTSGIKDTYRERTLEAALSGPPDSSISIELLDEKNKTRTLNIIRVAFSGEMSQPLGNFPAQEVVFESKMLPGNIGYIRFNMWVIPQMMKIRNAVRGFKDADGIIFDLRGNPGGVGGMASGVAGLLTDKQGSLGTMRSRGGKMEFIVYPQADAFSGPLVVITDHGSASTSEVFAAGLQESGRAKIIGGTTAGAVLPSVFVTLPTGALFQYAVSDYRSPKNILIEGRGVKPDVAVKQSRKALLAGSDAQLEAAIKIIQK